jgi:hypothetical protein
MILLLKILRGSWRARKKRPVPFLTYVQASNKAIDCIQKGPSTVHLDRVIEELIKADLGISINVSGLLDEVQQCCRKPGIERHSVEHSLGVWGAKERLPEKNVMEFNTMCGHGMVSFNFIRKMIEYVKLRRLTPKEAAKMMAKCCECGVFNPHRAEILLERVRKLG